MTEDLTLHTETLTNNSVLVQNTISSSDGNANDLRVNYESDNENEKPILLELGTTTNIPRTTVHYASNYPMDIHLNSLYGSGLPTHSHTYNIDPAVLYNNPYNNRIGTTLSQIPLVTSAHTTASSSLTALNNVPYCAHIPQTVFTWSTPTPVTSITPTNVTNKLRTEIVPSPVYLTYSDNREHAITRQINHSWKEKALQTEKDYKKNACDRERTRMRDMNRAFDLLRSKLPITKPNGKKYSKIESLRIAINYINHLQKILKDDTTDQTNMTAAKYLSQLNVRRRSSSNSYRFENHKSNTFDDVNDKLENLDESRSTWSDGYMPNSRDKWE